MDIGMLADVEAENTLLSSVLAKPKAIYDIMSKVNADDFYSQTNRVIYSTMQGMAQANIGIDLVTLVDTLKKNDSLEKVGGIMAITKIGQLTFTTANNDRYIEIIKDYAKRRKMVMLAEQMNQIAGDFEGGSQLEELQAKIAGLAIDNDSVIKPIKDDILDFHAELNRRREGAVGISTGFPALDKTLIGWQDSQLIVLAARPGIGKSAFALNCAVSAALAGKKVAYFSYEMSKYELISRVVAAQETIPMEHFVNASEMGEKEYNKILQFSEELNKCGLHLFDNVAPTPTGIIATCKQLQVTEGLDLVIVDYLQLLHMDSKMENRVNEVGYISWSMKRLAMQMDIPVITLSQLNRGVEGRNSKRPKLSDLRESGNIEQDANVVLALYREEDYEDEDGGMQNVIPTQLAILKNRNGSMGQVTLDYWGAYTKFESAKRDFGDSKPLSTGFNIPY